MYLLGSHQVSWADPGLGGHPCTGGTRSPLSRTSQASFRAHSHNLSHLRTGHTSPERPLSFMSYSQRPLGKKMKTISITMKTFCNFSILKHVPKHVFQKVSLSIANEHVSKHMTRLNISKQKEKQRDRLLSTWVSILLWKLHKNSVLLDKNALVDMTRRIKWSKC